MEEVVVIDAVRTPIGRYNGVLKDVRPDDLGAHVLRSLKERNPSLPLDEVEEVIFGNANGAGEDNRNVARMSTLLGGYPVETAATTLNRLCGSGLDAVTYAARAIMAGQGDIMIAGGTESMTRAPYVMGKPDKSFKRGAQQLQDTTIGWRFTNPLMEEMYGTDSMPETAQNVADLYQISRSDQDVFAYQSQMRAKEAMTSGRLNEEISPVTIHGHKGETHEVTEDEHPRPNTSIEKLSNLSSLFTDGSITAGNASGINDGASAVILMSRKKLNHSDLNRLLPMLHQPLRGWNRELWALAQLRRPKRRLNGLT